MLTLNGKKIEIGHFPDGTLLMKEYVERQYDAQRSAVIGWYFAENEELAALIYLVGHLKAHGVSRIHLDMPYIPNARQDRVKSDEDVFTLKYFADTINWLGFASVTVLDPHSTVSEALFDNLIVRTPQDYIAKVVAAIGDENLMMFYPDEGAMKRYSALADKPFAFGIKKRDWATGQIMGLDVSGAAERIKGSRVLIVDDICSRGGTFYHSAKKLKELGAAQVYLYVTHCENSILQGEVLTSGLIERVFTTNSILTAEHENITVLN